MSRRHPRNRNRNRNRGGPNSPHKNGQGQPNQQGQPLRQQPQKKEPEPPPHIPKRYGVVFFETFAQAKADLEALAAKAKEVDQLNIVIKAEGNQWDPDLLKVGKLFAGEAWHLIHTRRIDEHWYDTPH